MKPTNERLKGVIVRPMRDANSVPKCGTFRCTHFDVVSLKCMFDDQGHVPVDTSTTCDPSVAGTMYENEELRNRISAIGIRLRDTIAERTKLQAQLLESS